MRILVVSDTHGSPEFLLAAVRQAGQADMLLHLGDGPRDCQVLSGVFQGEIHTVKGNCDVASFDEETQILSIEGSTIFLTHGHLFSAKLTLQRLIEKGIEINADLVCFGHTHVPLLEKRGKLTLLNPGSLRQTRTFGIIEARQGSLNAKLERLKL